MNVLLVNNFLAPNLVGGAEISVGNLSRRLQQFGVRVITMSLAESNVTDEHLSIEYPLLKRVWTLNNNRTLLDRLFFQFASEKINFIYKQRIKEKIKAVDPDIIHTNNIAGIGSVVWEIARELGVPVVHTLRDYYQICARQTFYSKGQNCVAAKRCRSCKLLTATRKKYSQSVAVVVGNSRKTLELHIDSGFFKNAERHVISGGLNDGFGFLQEHKRRVEQPLQIGFIGQIIATKGVEVFLELAKLHPKRTFLIAGDGPSRYVQYLKEKHSRSNVKWLGRVDARTFFSSLDVLIVPSLWHEPLARVLYEAYSFGVPVIASDVGGNADVLTGKQREFLFPPGDYLTASKKLITIEKQIKTGKIEKKELVAISKMFTTHSVAERYLRLYESILKLQKKGGYHCE